MRVARDLRDHAKHVMPHDGEITTVVLFDRCPIRFRFIRTLCLALGLCAALLGSPHDGWPQHVSPRACPEIVAPDGIDTRSSVRNRDRPAGARQRPGARSGRPAGLGVPAPGHAARSDARHLSGGRAGSSAIEEVATSFLGSPAGQSLIEQRTIIAFDQRGFSGGDRSPWPALEAGLGPIDSSG